MENTTIKESFILPSHGHVYEQEVNDHFSLRSMTVNEEMLRLSPTEHEYDNLCNIIDACMVESPGISAYDMCIGDYTYCLYMLRLVTYGSEYKILPVCKYCGNSKIEKFNLEDMRINEWKDDFSNYLEFELPVNKSRITIKPLTPRILDNILDRVKRYKQKTNNGINPVILCEIMSLIRLIDGTKPNSVQLENFVRNLSMKDINTILNYSNKINTSIGIDNALSITCDYCGLAYNTKLSINSEFFRPTLDI